MNPAFRTGTRSSASRVVVPRHGMGGFTLIELMVVIAIAAILLGIGIPSFKNITTSYRISGEINNLLGEMQYARAEAIKEGQSVTICALAPGAGSSNTTPPTACASTLGTGWQNGWIVYPDPASAQQGPGTANAGSVLRYQPSLTQTSSDTMVDSSGNGTIAITFNREGLVNGLNSSNGATGGALITLHDPTANSRYTRCLLITSVGAVQVVQNSNYSQCT